MSRKIFTGILFLALALILSLTLIAPVAADVDTVVVSVNPSIAGTVDADYTITFNVGAAGALTQGVSTITITFPEGTTITDASLAGTVNGNAITADLVGNNDTRTVTLTTPVDVANDAQVIIILTAGITNPSVVGSAYTLQVQTSAETTNVASSAYSITPLITSATYNAASGVLVVTGAGFLDNGDDDIDVSFLTFTGQGGATYQLTDVGFATISSPTEFTYTLTETDRLNVSGILHRDGGSAQSGTVYNLAAAAGWMVGANTLADLTGNPITVSGTAAPAITSATYDFDDGILVVTGTNFVKFPDVNNDIDATKFSFTAEGVTRPLSTTDSVEITDATHFTLDIDGDDKTYLDMYINKNGLASVDTIAYNLAAADRWLPAADSGTNIAIADCGDITVSNVPAPTIDSATYHAGTGALVVTGTGFTHRDGADNDIDATKFTVTGEGGNTRILNDGTSTVEITDATHFTLTIGGADKTFLDMYINKNLTSSTGGTTYNLAAALEWAAGSDDEAADNTIAVTANNVPVPAITGAAYNYTLGTLTVTGTGFTLLAADDDINATKFTITAEGRIYPLTDTPDTNIMSGTSFILTLGDDDLAALNLLFNKNGLSSTNTEAYNLNAAEDWIRGADAGVVVADATIPIDVSNVPVPEIFSATYDFDNGILVVTGTGFVRAAGDNNDIDLSLLTITGEGGNTAALSSTTDVEIESVTQFTVTLDATDKNAVNMILNKDLTSSTGGTTYNLAAALLWAAGSDDEVAYNTIGITVSDVQNPETSSATYDWVTGKLVVTGVHFVKSAGDSDIDSSLFWIYGEGGSYRLTDTPDVDITSSTIFTLTLSDTDKEFLNRIINKNGSKSTGVYTYSVSPNAGWMPGASVPLDSPSYITVSNVPAPAITSATYDWTNGVLVVTGTGFTHRNIDEDIDATKFSITAEGETYPLTNTLDVDITNGTTFTLTLSAADKAAVNLIVNREGTKSTDTNDYNLAAAEDWARGADAAVDVVDLTSGITVSGMSKPTITNTTYNYTTGVFTVTGTNFVKKAGPNNDIDLGGMGYTGEGGGWGFSNTADVEIASATSFTVTLDAADKDYASMFFNQEGIQSTGGVSYEFFADGIWVAGTNPADFGGSITDSGNEISVSALLAPVIDSAEYDWTAGTLTVTGANFVKKAGVDDNDIDVSLFTFRGEGDNAEEYTLQNTSDMDIASSSTFTITLDAADKLVVNTIMNKDGVTSTGGNSYLCLAGEDWDTGAVPATDIEDNDNVITVANIGVPTIVSATYDKNSGELVVTGTGFTILDGEADIDVSKLTFLAEGHTLTFDTNETDDPDITNGTSFSLTVGGADRSELDMWVNRIGLLSTDNIAYNLTAIDDFNRGSRDGADMTDAGLHGVTASNVGVPTITNVEYDSSIARLTVTGTSFVHRAGGANDIDVAKFIFTGETGTYTLTDATDVEIDSATQFTINLNAADKAGVNPLMNIEGTRSMDGTWYNLNAQEDWAVGATAAVNVVSANNQINVSNVLDPNIISATYDWTTGNLVVTGTDFVHRSGIGGSEVIAAMFTIHGNETDASYTLIDTPDVDITDSTHFTLALGAQDKLHVHGLLNANGTQSGAIDYDLTALDNWMAGTVAAHNIEIVGVDSITVSNVQTPTITSATYDSSTGELVVTGTNFFKMPEAFDIDASMFTFTGFDADTYTLTDTTNVEITSVTEFTMTLNETDKAAVNLLLDQFGTEASDATVYNLAAADGWLAGALSTANIEDLAGNGITVFVMPTITSATYDWDSGELVVAGANIQANGAGADIDVSKLTITGEGEVTYTLTDTPDVERDSLSQFTVTLSVDDKAAVNMIVNKNGNAPTGASTWNYNLAAADDWDTNVTDGNTADASTVIDVSNVAVPAITSATYNWNTGVLVVTGTGFTKYVGATNDIDASTFTFTAEGGETLTLTDTADGEITSGTQFTLTLGVDDKAALDLIVNKNGTSSTGGTTYNLAAAEDWARGADADVNVVDAGPNAVTVSNVGTPTVTSATYNASTGVLVVTATNLYHAAGATNDIDATKFTITAEGTTYTLTAATLNVEVTSAATFTLTIAGADKAALDLIINKDGVSSTNTIAYNLAAAEDWARGADAAVIIADLAGNGITVSNVAVPAITSSTYDWATGALVVTGENFVKSTGDDIDATKFIFTAEDDTITLTGATSNVEITSSTTFTITVAGVDKDALNLVINKNGTQSTDGEAYNLEVEDDWMRGAGADGNVDETNPITASNVPAPTIESATYNWDTGALVVTGTGFSKRDNADNDIDASMFTITGEDGETHTLTNTADVEITNGTTFTLTLSATDKAAVNMIINKNGAASTGGTAYNMAAAEDWARGADAAVNVADGTIAVTVSNVAAPEITSSTYFTSTGILTVTGTGFTKSTGADNDIDASLFTFTGNNTGTYILTDTADVEITSGTTFILTLSATDKAAVNPLLDLNGAEASDGTDYNLAAAEDWAKGADAAVIIADTTIPITVSAGPEFDLTAAGDALADGGTKDFGNHNTATNTDVEFTITNNGDADLTFTAPITIGGANADQFSIQAQPASPVAAAGNTAFTIRFTPTSAGLKTATITINNNDGDENPYNITITGTGTVAGGGGAPEPPVQIPPTLEVTPDAETSQVELDEAVDDAGKFTQRVVITTEEEDLTVDIPKNVIGTYTDENNQTQPITAITVEEIEIDTLPPQAADDAVDIIIPYNMEPDGAVFSQPITITYVISEDDIPEGVNPFSTTIGFFNETTGKWVELSGVTVVHNADGTYTISGQTTHFTLFALIFKTPPATPDKPTPTPDKPTPTPDKPTPTPDKPTPTATPDKPAPTATGTVTPTSTAEIDQPAEKDAEGLSWWVYVIIGIAVIVIIGVVRYGWNMRRD